MISAPSVDRRSSERTSLALNADIKGDDGPTGAYYQPLMATEAPPFAPPAGQRFVARFPPALERYLQSFDDKLIACCQAGTNTRAGPFMIRTAQALSSLTTIEVGFALPLFLLLIWQDCLAVYASYVVLAMALGSQVPKRFIWRVRPFAAGRARKYSRVKTSSFPSRAVVGAAAYTKIVCQCIHHFHTGHCMPTTLPLGTLGQVLSLVAAVVASYARILLGVHYPSDCATGGLLGLVVVMVGTGAARAHIDGCSCCPSSHDDDGTLIINSSAWVVIGVGIVVALACTGAMLAPPLCFWNKCAHAFGLLLPAMIFEAALLCPDLTNQTVPSTNNPSMGAVAVAALLTAFLTLAGFTTQHHKRFQTSQGQYVGFVVLFTVTFVVLVAARSKVW